MDFPTIGALGWFHPPSLSTKELSDPGPVMMTSLCPGAGLWQEWQLRKSNFLQCRERGVLDYCCILLSMIDFLLQVKSG